MELQEKCERVEGDSHIISLAKEMTDHLTFLSQTISDTRFVLQNRLHQLKVRVCKHRPSCPYVSS
ncbi:hypothetical protein E2C01_054766 [Portunus trituberculatus]|uniref:Uncharacterized protein n=1 Tax=Portunus trituberculatus TaxID=210409 RepID=A0A5B7GKI6_PORTR|nr:hypothetical protein [Portunus trituberculatus]